MKRNLTDDDAKAVADAAVEKIASSLLTFAGVFLILQNWSEIPGYIAAVVLFVRHLF